MAVTVDQYVPKLEKLLEKFAEPNFEIENDVYLNTLLSNLSGKENEELGERLRNIPLLTKWIIEVTRFWECNITCPSNKVAVFTLNLLALLSKDEEKFIIFKSNNIYERIIKLFNVQSNNCNPSLKLGYITLMSSFLNHYNGREYCVQTKYWYDALKYCLSNQTVYIIKEGRDFLYNLLEKTKENVAFGNMVAEEIISILFKNHFQNGTSFPEIKEEQLRMTITPTLELICYILEMHFKSENFKNKNHHIPTLFMKNQNLEKTIWQMVLLVHNSDLLVHLEKLMIMFYFLELHMKSTEEIYAKDQLMVAVTSIFQLIRTHFSKREIKSMIILCHWIHYFWQYLIPRCPEPCNGKPHYFFEVQVLILQMMPLFCVINKYCVGRCSEVYDDFRDNFVRKLFKVMCEGTIRTSYSWRSVIMDSDNVLDYAQLAIHYLLKSRVYFKRDTAVLCFQAFLHCVKDTAFIALNYANNMPIHIDKFSVFVVNVVDAVILFIEDYDFSWRESVETICIMTSCVDILKQPDLKPKAVVRTLKLLNLSIAKFMAPNLALLVDKTAGTAMESLGSLILMKLNDFNWEIRDSALEILHTIAEYSQTKFPSFKKIVLTSEFPSLLVTMCTSDSENYVRASAIKCLQKMIQVSSFWYPHLEEKNLPEKMIEILLNESEGIVRCEAATLICDIYFYQSFHEDLMPDIYKIMTQSVTNDLHWEVKLKALTFWEHVVNNELKNQGMIDGTFPTVTFSKEHKKIVTLTNSEIATRLNKALIELSKCGCLGVLMSTVLDDCDLQVSKRALTIVKILSDLLVKYKVKFARNLSNSGSSCSGGSFNSNSSSPIHNKNLISPSNYPSSLSPSTSPSTFNNDILEEILDTKDINILTRMMTSEHNDTYHSKNIVRELIIVTPDVFLNFVQKDLTSLISARENWLNDIDSLDSLLDDMLKTYDYDDDVNKMDCY